MYRVALSLPLLKVHLIAASVSGLKLLGLRAMDESSSAKTEDETGDCNRK